MMKYFLENRITAYMLFGGLALFGIIGLGRLPVSLMPQTGYPGISVIIEYPGVAPEKIETLITRPVEKIIKTISDIETIDSVSEEGKSRININFQINTDIRIAALKVREKIGLIRGWFPREVQEPVIFRYDPSDRPVLIASMERKGASPVEIREIAERNIKPLLQRIEGVSEINIAGGLHREIHINIDRGRFEARSLSFEDIFPIIQGSNTALPGGLLPCGNREYVVYTSCRYRSISEISDTAVALTQQGSLVKIYDFAEVVPSFREREDIARLDGKERVTIYVQKAGDANTLSVCSEAVKLLNSQKNCKTRIVYNQGTYITAAIDNVVSSCLWGIVIVILILYLFIKRFNIVLTIGLSMPVSIIIVFLCMYFLQLNLNVMSLSGLALGIGMIVDNGIVITDSIFSEKELNNRSICNGVSHVKNAIISSTFTTIVVFLPVVFGTVITRRLYGELAFTVSSALIISLAVAVILIPTIFSAIAERKEGPAVHFALYKKIKPRIDFILNKFDDMERELKSRYGRGYDYAFANRKRVFMIIGALFFLSLITITKIKSEFVDPASTGEFYVYLEFPTGTSLAYTDEAVSRAEKKIQSMKIAEKVSTKVEKWRGTLSIRLEDEYRSIKDEREVKNRLKRELGDILRKYGGFVFLTEADEVAARELNITFIGNENDELRKLARGAARSIGALPGIEDCVLRFREGRPEYVLSVDRSKSEVSMVSAQQATSFFRSAVFGPVVTKFIDHDREVDVRMRYLKEQRASIDSILNYSIKSESGSLIPVKEIVTVEERTAPTKIWRKNGRRCVTVTAKLGTLSFDEAERKIAEALSALTFPEEYTYEFDENLKKMKENRRSMMVSISFAVIFVYMILASLFESLKIPLIIMITVPLALIGVILTLFITGSSLNISVYIGLIVLAGIVVNNGIILVNAVNRGFKTGEMTADNIAGYIRSTCLRRFRPVLITTITTVLGLFPMLIKGGEGSNLWRPLSLTVISGLLFSTALTLIIVPMVCSMIYGTYFNGGETEKKIL